jgi:hypothetical protein
MNDLGKHIDTRMGVSGETIRTIQNSAIIKFKAELERRGIKLEDLIDVKQERKPNKC